jgi:hypothetical protein
MVGPFRWAWILGRIRHVEAGRRHHGNANRKRRFSLKDSETVDERSTGDDAREQLRGFT